MKLLLLATALLSGLVASRASAQEVKPPEAPAARANYISIGGGMTGSSDYSYEIVGLDLEADVSSGSAFGAAWGTHAGNWRFEFAGGYRNQDVESTLLGVPLSDSGSVSAISLDLNAYYDFPVSGRVRPYVGAGLGLAAIEVDDGVLDDSGDALNLQVMAGVSYQASQNIAVFVEGRLQRLSTNIEIDTGGSTEEEDLDITNGAVLVGLRFAI